MAETVEIDIVANDKTSGIIQGIFQGIGQTLANFALQIPGAIVNFGRDLIEQANEAQLALADLEATIKSTGGVAGITADEALELADSLSQVTRFSDDSILAGENMLLTFTNIGEEVFPDATKALLDLATKMKSDLPNAAIQLGKALNDPIAGVTALRRVGVQLTDEQEEQIKKFMELGDIMSAQKIILEELNKEFGGQATAAGETFAGMMDILKNRIENVKESIGMALLPVLTDLMDRVVIPLIPLIERLAEDFANWISNIPELAEGFQPFIDSINGVVMPLLEGLRSWWEENGTAIIAKVQEIGQSITDFIQTAWTEYLQPFIEEQLPKLSAWWEENAPLIAELLNNLRQAFEDALPRIGGLLEALSPLFESSIDFFLEWWELILQVLTGDWAGAWESAGEIVINFTTAIGEVLQNFAGLLVESLGFERNDIVAVWTDNWNQLLQIVDTVSNLIEGRIDQLIESVTSGMGEVVQSLAVGALGDSVGGVVAGAITGGFGGGRAEGGNVNSGTSYLVGERGAEIFTPSQSGFITPNGAGGNISITLNYSPAVSLGSKQEAEQTLLPFILEGIRKAQANGLVGVA